MNAMFHLSIIWISGEIRFPSYMVLTVNMIASKRSHSHPSVNHVFDMERFMNGKLKEKLRDYYDEGRKET
jgi:hypothetical protein